MKTEFKKLPRGQGEFVIELSVEEFAPFVLRATETLSQAYPIQGFRPGKAPYEVLKGRLGEGHIWEEALEHAVKKTLLEAIKDQKIDTVGSPKLDVIKLAPGNPVSYKAVVNVFPAIENLTLTGIKVMAKKAMPDEKEVERAIADLKKMRATETAVTREVKPGDKVEVDFTISVDGIPIEGGDGKKIPIIIGEKHFIPGFEEELIGLSAGATKEFDLSFPKKYHQPNLAGKKAHFKVSVTNVFAVALPEINDEFAKQLRFDSAQKLKEAISDNVRLQAEEKEDRRVEDELMNQLIEKNNFSEIPDLLVHSEAKSMLDEMAQGVKQQGIDFEDYLKHLKKTRDQMLLDLTPAAVKRIKGAILFRQAAQLNNLMATDQEVADEIARVHAGHAHAKDHSHDSPEERAYYKNILTSRKVMSYLKGQLVGRE